MPNTCAVSDCTNSGLAKSANPDLMFHGFPLKNKAVLKVWIAKCKRKCFNPETARICSEHFTFDDYERDLMGELLNLPRKKRLKPEAVPTVFKNRELVGASNRLTRSKRRNLRRKRAENEIAVSVVRDGQSSNLDDTRVENSSSKTAEKSMAKCFQSNDDFKEDVTLNQGPEEFLSESMDMGDSVNTDDSLSNIPSESLTYGAFCGFDEIGIDKTTTWCQTPTMPECYLNGAGSDLEEMRLSVENQLLRREVALLKNQLHCALQRSRKASENALSLENVVDSLNEEILQLNHGKAGQLAKVTADVNETEAKITEDLKHRLAETNQELDAVKCICQKLKAQLDTLRPSEEALKRDPDLLKHYTGLQSWPHLESLVKLVTDGMDLQSNHFTLKFDQLMVFFLRIRLGLPLKDIAYRYKISKATANKRVLNILNILSSKFHSGVCWPVREVLCASVPAPFRKQFDENAVVIVDCIELPIEKPIGYYVSPNCWKDYRNISSLKYLVGLTLDESVTFFSSGWSGQVCEKELSAQSKLIDSLLPGDFVIAARSSPYQSYVAMTLNAGKVLTRLDVDWDQSKYAKVLKHLDRTVGLLQSEFKILQSPLHVSLLDEAGSGVSVVDNVMKVCCSLLNFNQNVSVEPYS